MCLPWTACPAGLMYCLDYLKSNMDWLREKLQPFEKGEQRHGRHAYCSLRSAGHVRQCSWPMPHRSR